MTTLSRNTFTLIISNAGSAVLSFALSVLIGRMLGKDGLGVYTAALAWVFPLSLVAEFGLGTLLTREAAQETAQETSLLKMATQARLLLGGGLMIGLMLAAPIISSDQSIIRGLQISSPLILINPLFGNYTAIFRARQRMWPIPWLNMGMLIAQVSLTTIVFGLGGDVLAALVVNTLTSAAQLTAAWWMWRRWFYIKSSGQVTALPLRIGSLLKKAWPFAAAAVLAAIQIRLAPILLEQMTDSGSVGYYAAATRFAEAARTLPNALFGALLPMMAALAGQHGNMIPLLRKVLGGLAAYGAAAAAIFMLLSSTILSLTYGDTFLDATATLQVVMWGLLPSLLRAGLTLYWYATGGESLVNKVLVITALAQVGLSLWLIPVQGVVGAAVAVAAAEATGVILLFIPIVQANHRDEQQ